MEAATKEAGERSKGKTTRTGAVRAWTDWVLDADPGDLWGGGGWIRTGPAFLVSRLTSQWCHLDISRKKGTDWLQGSGKGTLDKVGSWKGPTAKMILQGLDIIT